MFITSDTQTNIHLIHGAVEGQWHDSQGTRNYVAAKSLREYLARRNTMYLELNEAPGFGEYLTVDDSTVGAAMACKIAREEGHNVTIFVNPYQIINGVPYFFSVLDAILDQCPEPRMTYENTSFQIRDKRELKKLRLAVRSRMMTLPADTALAETIEFGIANQIESVEIPRHAQTMSLEDLIDLKEYGVNIGTHGWDHRDIKSMSFGDLVSDLSSADRWLTGILGKDVNVYAVPFGLATLPDDISIMESKCCFLANSAIPIGRVGPSCWNRSEITSLVKDHQL